MKMSPLACCWCKIGRWLGRRWFQLDAEHERLGLAGREVVVRLLRCGTMRLLYGGTKLGGGKNCWPDRHSPLAEGKSAGAAGRRARHQAVTASGKFSLRSLLSANGDILKEF